jgi:hypothetical protein
VLSVARLITSSLEDITCLVTQHLILYDVRFQKRVKLIYDLWFMVFMYFLPVTLGSVFVFRWLTFEFLGEGSLLLKFAQSIG